MGKWKYEKRAVYSIYKGDDILYTGILDECAEYLKIKINTAKFYAQPSQIKRIKKKGLVLVRIDKDDDYEDLQDNINYC